MVEPIRIGSLRVTPLSTVAAKAAKRIIAMRSPKKYAVTCCHSGNVEIEPAEQAIDDEVVGVYDPTSVDQPGETMTDRLARQIEIDLMEHRAIAHAA